ncbi:MAG: hypothetical protein IJ240_11255 [Clostridia bacterium]|nr:hypothetical protein [Clostridia bacterium]
MKRWSLLILALCLALGLHVCAQAESGLTLPKAEGETLMEAGGLSLNDVGAYRVFVTDENGEPVAGAALQLCSDTLCVLAWTDEDGVAVYETETGSYTVHLLKAPEGYQPDDTEYPVWTAYCDLRLTLRPAAT